jgi:hypothetical protein
MKRAVAMRWGRRAGLLLAALASILGVASLPWAPGRRSEAPRLEEVAVGAGALRAGAAQVDLPVPPGGPIAGYARLRWRSEGLRDPVAARALVLSEPGCTVAIASVDLLLVPADLEARIREELAGVHLDGLVVAATHTHAGPGGYWSSIAGQRIATGPYDRRLRDGIASSVAQAIRLAASEQQPATLATVRARFDTLVANRSGGRPDGRLLGIRVARPEGSPIAELIVFPSHGTVLGLRNRRISGDWPAQLSRAGTHGTRLVLQGALGNHSPDVPGTTPLSPESYAARLDAELRRLEYGPADGAPALGYGTSSVLLPPSSLAAAPRPLRPAAANLAAMLLPSRTRVAALRLGSTLLLVNPAEPVSEVGAAWRAAAGEGAEVVSLAGDYVGYAETPARVLAGTGEAIHTYYGPDLADRLEQGLVATARALDAARPGSAAPAGGRAAPFPSR